MEVYLELFWIFFKIGAFTLGGGYAILPLIQADVVDFHKWLNIQQFTDIVAISQVTPGPISLNSATYVGYLVGNKAGIWNGVLAGTIATIGLILPSVIVMTFFSKFYLKFQDNKYMDNAFAGLKIVVVGLILAAAILLIDKNNFIK
ncbi:chromate transporter [Leptotrichia sp. HSP-334]|uniref:Chromate transporter n=1 Tax=Leptotrichia rugosa TaxID=3239302 RepID=A0AB39VHF9_9FUSO